MVVPLAGILSGACRHRRNLINVPDGLMGMDRLSSLRIAGSPAACCHRQANHKERLVVVVSDVAPPPYCFELAAGPVFEIRGIKAGYVIQHCALDFIKLCGFIACCPCIYSYKATLGQGRCFADTRNSAFVPAGVKQRRGDQFLGMAGVTGHLSSFAI